MQNSLEAALYIVPTPIGNLGDITRRAMEVLGSADVIACEDTRRAGVLFQQLKIEKSKFVSYHILNETERSMGLIESVKQGKTVALISDAGTPGISDPGYRIIRTAIDNGIKVIPLPGAVAFISALVASGLPTNKFIFLGFPPHKKGRKTFLDEACSYNFTTILYESPHRVIKLMRELIDRGCGERQICLAREISKMFEEFIRGDVNTVFEQLTSKDKIKGEFVVIVEGNNTENK